GRDAIELGHDEEAIEQARVHRRARAREDGEEPVEVRDEHVLLVDAPLARLPAREAVLAGRDLLDDALEALGDPQAGPIADDRQVRARLLLALEPAAHRAVHDAAIGRHPELTALAPQHAS